MQTKAKPIAIIFGVLDAIAALITIASGFGVVAPFVSDFLSANAIWLLPVLSAVFGFSAGWFFGFKARLLAWQKAFTPKEIEMILACKQAENTEGAYTIFTGNPVAGLLVKQGVFDDVSSKFNVKYSSYVLTQRWRYILRIHPGLFD